MVVLRTPRACVQTASGGEGGRWCTSLQPPPTRGSQRGHYRVAPKAPSSVAPAARASHQPAPHDGGGAVLRRRGVVYVAWCHAIGAVVLTPARLSVALGSRNEIMN